MISIPAGCCSLLHGGHRGSTLSGGCTPGRPSGRPGHERARLQPPGLPRGAEQRPQQRLHPPATLVLLTEPPGAGVEGTAARPDCRPSQRSGGRWLRRAGFRPLGLGSGRIFWQQSATSWQTQLTTERKHGHGDDMSLPLRAHFRFIYFFHSRVAGVSYHPTSNGNDGPAFVRVPCHQSSTHTRT